MLNPSTADAYDEDPTLRRCITFAKREGFGSLSVGNLFAYRATDPANLLEAHKHGERPEGPLNDSYLEKLRDHAAHVIVAWGAVPKPLRYRIDEVLELLKPRALFCLGTTKEGYPCHPVRLANATPLKLYRPPTSTVRLPPFYREPDVPF